jgi:acyl-CoA reductase-like NAD-dependent aldehyde dehydrogenase
VLVVIAYRDLDDALAIANESDYGLGGTIWTADVDKGTEVARRLQTGTAGVNFCNVDISAPYGGIKSSELVVNSVPKVWRRFRNSSPSICLRKRHVHSDQRQPPV